MSGAPPPGGPEQLMTEHGLLDRALLVYEEAIDRHDNGKPLPAAEAGTAALVVRTMIHDHHEEMEEQFVFPAFTSGELKDECAVLLEQHHAGKKITDRLIVDAAAATRSTWDAMAEGMRDFITMYRPHEAREDTMIFPAWRETMDAAKFTEVGYQMRLAQAKLLGGGAFETVLNLISGAEQSLGIFELDQFTPNRQGDAPS